MLNNEEKLEQEKTDEVKASSSLVSDTENSDKDLVEKDIKEETADESQALYLRVKCRHKAQLPQLLQLAVTHPYLLLMHKL